jgi:transposase
VDVVHARCCGLDVHKKSVVACVLITAGDGTVDRQVRTFSTMTPDLLALADWLSSLGVTHVALESTGVYWRPVVRHEALFDREGMKGPLPRTVAAVSGS